jgi:guanosine-3',5'-bis(diphosphate) 3'-pyrophosphohydrolase
MAVNQPGSLATVTSAIASCEANIHNLMMRMGSPDFHKFVFEIEVRDLAQLSDVLAALKLAPGISDVRRAAIAEARGLSKMEWSAVAETEPA